MPDMRRKRVPICVAVFYLAVVCATKAESDSCAFTAGEPQPYATNAREILFDSGTLSKPFFVQIIMRRMIYMCEQVTDAERVHEHKINSCGICADGEATSSLGVRQTCSENAAKTVRPPIPDLTSTRSFYRLDSIGLQVTNTQNPTKQ